MQQARPLNEHVSDDYEGATGGDTLFQRISFRNGENHMINLERSKKANNVMLANTKMTCSACDNSTTLA